MLYIESFILLFQVGYNFEKEVLHLNVFKLQMPF